MTTSGAIKLLEMVNPIIKRSTSYVRRLEIDEEDRSIKFINLWGSCLHRHYYNINANAIDLCYDIFDYLTD